MSTGSPLPPPNTVTQSTHAVTIHANNTIIGAINQWSPEQTLAVNAVYQFGSPQGPYGDEFGAPYEKVPGNISGQTITVQRYDLYTQQMEQAFGTTNALDMLSSDLGQPNGGTGHVLTIREFWLMPESSPVSSYNILYHGCWFSRIGRTLSATDDRIVNVNATIEYTRKERVAVS